MKDSRPIASAPFGRDIQVSVIEKGDVHALVGPVSDAERMAQPASNYLSTQPISASGRQTDPGLFLQEEASELDLLSAN